MVGKKKHETKSEDATPVKAAATPVKAAAESPVKAGACSYAKSSPAKNRLSIQQIKEMKKPAGWFLQTWLTNSMVQFVGCTYGNYKEDSFGMKSLRDGVKDGRLKDVNAIGVYRMRKSLSNGDVLLGKSGHPRRVLAIALDDHELNEEALMANVVKVQDFLGLIENNKYGTEVHIEKDNWNLTIEPPQPLKNMDSYIVYDDIKKLMEKLFGEDQVTPRFVENNREAAFEIFTAGSIPMRAHHDLGFEAKECLPTPVVNVD